MGKRGGKRGGRGGRGGGRRDGGGRPDNRTDKASLPRTNERFERYYNELGIVPEDERAQFWKFMRTDLPNSFRFTGSKAHALAVQERLRDFYIPEIKSIKHEGEYVEPPLPVDWYPDKLAWYMTTPKSIIRRFKPFANFQKFLVAESDVGNITRQEVVSMIPPLVMDIKPGMTVLDLCAAPGSKSAQLLEMICGGEEDRARQVAHNLANGLDRPAGEAFADDGRATGLLIANDVDYKRAHMLVHQMKRLSSPNMIVTNHDATIYPSIKIPAEPGPDGKIVQNKYLKFDRILADVPCSGDGTLRKNVEIWKQWTPSNGLGLHATQVKILIRALQMLKVGGRVVYSTCSMNPVEDEAVLSSAIQHCGGSSIVQLMETRHLLPGLKRSAGLKQWKIMDKAGRIWPDWESVEKHKAEKGDAGLDRLTESMFPSKENIPVDRAMRVYPHSQNTGAFFIAILEKKSEIKKQSQQQPVTAKDSTTTETVEVADSNGTTNVLETEMNGEVKDTNGTVTHDSAELDAAALGSIEASIDTQLAADPNPANAPSSPSKRKAEDDPSAPDAKKPKTDTPPTQSLPTNGPPNTRVKNKSQQFEEPFKFLPSTHPALTSIYTFYNLAPTFPRSRFMVRNPDALPTKNIYYTTALARDILQCNEGKGMKFVHSGVKMFVKQDAPSPEVCPWRIQTDGLRILETWVGQERQVRLRKRETLRKLLVEMFPRFVDDDWASLGELGEQMRDKTMGCFVLVVEPTDAAEGGGGEAGGDGEGEGLNERMVFPLWKSIHSLNLMMPKEDRRAMLLRLFNDDSPLINMNQQSREGREKAAAGASVQQEEQAGVQGQRENTSSPEPEQDKENGAMDGVLEDGDVKSEAGGVDDMDEDDGGVKIDI